MLKQHFLPAGAAVGAGDGRLVLGELVHDRLIRLRLVRDDSVRDRLLRDELVRCRLVLDRLVLDVRRRGRQHGLLTILRRAVGPLALAHASAPSNGSASKRRSWWCSRWPSFSRFVSR